MGRRAAGPALGARFDGVNTHPAMGTWTTRSTIVAFDPPTQLAWAVGDPDNRAATWRFLLTGHHDVTQLRYRVVIGPGPSGVTMLIARDPNRRGYVIAKLKQFHDNMIRTVCGIKALAEEATTPMCRHAASRRSPGDGEAPDSTLPTVPCRRFCRSCGVVGAQRWAGPRIRRTKGAPG